MNVTIRDERLSDVAAIEKLIIDAFRDAPHASHTEQAIVNALRDANALTISLVAESKDAIVGHVALSPVSITDGSPDWYGLGPIAVAPAHQGLGIGSRLMRTSLERLQEIGAAGCVLLGDPGFYHRFGFVAQPGLTLPGVPSAYFMAIAFGHGIPEGSVTYHAAFDTKC